MPALPFAARSEGADRDREAPGVRSSRAPAAGEEHQASTYRCAHCRGVTGAASRRRGFLAGAIWRALQGGGGLHERPAVDPRGSDRADDERHIRRASGLFGERRRLGGQKAEELTPVYGGSASASPARRFAISTRRAIGSAASCNGCTRLRAFASPSIAPEKSAATFQEFERRRRRSRPLQALRTGSSRSSTPSATPISCANSRA